MGGLNLNQLHHRHCLDDDFPRERGSADCSCYLLPTLLLYRMFSTTTADTGFYRQFYGHITRYTATTFTRKLNDSISVDDDGSFTSQYLSI